MEKVILVAYKKFEQTDANGLEGWPSEHRQILEEQEDDYLEAGFFVDYLYDFNVYKESMATAYEAWENEFHPKPKVVRITRIIPNKCDPLTPPTDIDFISGLPCKLHRKSILVKGECIREEFYLTYDGATYGELMVKEETTYTRDTLGFPIYKDVMVSWALEDGSFHEKKKTWRKFYSQLEKIDEGKVRRGNLIKGLQMPTIGLIAMAMNGNLIPTPQVILEGRRFLADYQTEFQLFVDDSNKAILTCLNDVNEPHYVSVADYHWIDFVTPYGVTVRQWLTNEMTI